MLNGSEFPELPALVIRYGGSQIPDKWLKECRYNQCNRTMELHFAGFCTYDCVFGITTESNRGNRKIGNDKGELISLLEIIENKGLADRDKNKSPVKQTKIQGFRNESMTERCQKDCLRVSK